MQPLQAVTGFAYCSTVIFAVGWMLFFTEFSTNVADSQ